MTIGAGGGRISKHKREERGKQKDKENCIIRGFII
jgi:hypothetical protein